MNIVHHRMPTCKEKNRDMCVPEDTAVSMMCALQIGLSSVHSFPIDQLTSSQQVSRSVMDQQVLYVLLGKKHETAHAVCPPVRSKIRHRKEKD